jgi:hypothetical protein
MNSMGMDGTPGRQAEPRTGPVTLDYCLSQMVNANRIPPEGMQAADPKERGQSVTCVARGGTS